MIFVVQGLWYNVDMNLPPALVRTLHSVHDDAGPWLEALPVYLKHLEQSWHIQFVELVEDLSYNVVAFAEGEDGIPYVLKMSPPGNEFLQEVTALKLYDGDGIARLIRADEAGGAMLLERLHPGVSFWRSDDDELATRTCAELLVQLWRPVEDTSHLRTLRSWAEELFTYPDTYAEGGPIPLQLVQKAITLLENLLKNDDAPVLLHADLHHGNILSATRQPYLAIDPKGIVGARGYDVGTFLGNPAGVARRTDLDKLLDTRLSIFSEMLSVAKTELIAWSFVHDVLSACWTIDETGQMAEGVLFVSERLDGFL